MDLGLFTGVLRRSRFLVLAGLVVACAAAVFAMARVEVVNGHPRLVYRNPQLYQSTVQVLVTQRGFPEGRSVFNTSPTPLSSGRVERPAFADPTRFQSLALVYSQLIMGNVERVRVFGPGKPPRYEAIFATPMAAPGGGNGFLPIVVITGVAPSPVKAAAVADKAATTFSTYLVQRQNQTSVALSDRVILDRIAGPLKPTVYLPRKKTRAIFAFALILILTITAAFMRENVSNRRAAAAEETTFGDPSLDDPASPPDTGQHGTALAHDL